jgi:hypothetical protein
MRGLVARFIQLFRRATGSSLYGLEYRVAFKLYSLEGEREVEVLEFLNGKTYMIERERMDGGEYKARHSGGLVGPFASPEDAEAFIVATPWFNGRKS